MKNTTATTSVTPAPSATSASSRLPIGVVGAGTMGAGIAQVAAVAGRRVLIADAVPGAAERAVGQIRDRVKAAVAKGRLTVDPIVIGLNGPEKRNAIGQAMSDELPAALARG